MILALAAVASLQASPPLDGGWGRELLTPEFAACLRQARAERPQQHCRAVEIARQSAALDREFAGKLAQTADAGLRARLPADQARWRREADAACEVEARRSRATLAASRAQACKLQAYTARRVQVRIL